MMAGSDIANGCASSLTETVSRAESRANSARRVGSASAAKVWSRSRSRAPPLYLTMWFSIGVTDTKSRHCFCGIRLFGRAHPLQRPR